MEDEEILKVSHLCKSFVVEKKISDKIKRLITKQNPESIKALNDVSFSVKRGEILGILGESGSGKSTLARVLMGIHKADFGEAYLLGRDILGAKDLEKLAVYRDMQMIFQDPFSSLDPRMTVKQILLEPLKIHQLVYDDKTGSLVHQEPNIENIFKLKNNIFLNKNVPDFFLKDALKEVGLSPDSLNKYPSEFSGGQRQRIGICRALILNPKLIIADEAVSALDVSVQAQILELLMELKKKRGLSMIFISHDVAVVRQISDRIILLYHGEIVEELPADKLLTDAKHEYSKKLLNAALSLREGCDFKFIDTKV